MRTLFTVIIGAIICAASYAQTTDVDNEYDFGSVWVKEKHATHTFKIVNKKTKPLIIKDARARCGCMEQIWSQEPIQCGDTAFVSVRYHFNGLGVFNKKVKVVTNDTTFFVRVKGEVVKH